jgi:hypothetical protein
MQNMSPHSIDPSDAVSNVAVDLLLTVVTCGIYNVFWQRRQFRVLNAFLGREEFRFVTWILLTLVTCGIYHMYTEYLMGRAITAIQRDLGKPPAENLSLISLMLSVFGLTVVADAIQQSEINDFFAA